MSVVSIDNLTNHEIIWEVNGLLWGEQLSQVYSDLLIHWLTLIAAHSINDFYYWLLSITKNVLLVISYFTDITASTLCHINTFSCFFFFTDPVLWFL